MDQFSWYKPWPATISPVAAQTQDRPLYEAGVPDTRSARIRGQRSIPRTGKKHPGFSSHSHFDTCTVLWSFFFFLRSRNLSRGCRLWISAATFKSLDKCGVKVVFLFSFSCFVIFFNVFFFGQATIPSCRLDNPGSEVTGVQCFLYNWFEKAGSTCQRK